MNTTPPDGPVYSLRTRKALRLIVMIPLLVVFVAVLLHHKGFVDLAGILDVPESYLYYGVLGMTLLALVSAFFVWKCPCCGSHLGKKPNPVRCDSCGAEFR